jgi:hypothetical protein
MSYVAEIAARHAVEVVVTDYAAQPERPERRHEREEVPMMYVYNSDVLGDEN